MTSTNLAVAERYEVNISQVTNASTLCPDYAFNTTIATNETSLMVGGLEAFTEYSVVVTAINEQISSRNSSTPLNFTTPEAGTLAIIDYEWSKFDTIKLQCLQKHLYQWWIARLPEASHSHGSPSPVSTGMETSPAMPSCLGLWGGRLGI